MSTFSIPRPRGMTICPAYRIRVGIAATLFTLLAITAVADVPRVQIDYYGEIGCSHCDAFVAKAVPRLETKFDVSLAVEAFDILNASAYAECADRLARLGRPFRTFPVLFIGNNVYQGRAVDPGIEAELDYFTRHGEFRPVVPALMDGSREQSPRGAPGLTETLRVIPVLLAGLADGINPCAFATMIFLVSLLAMVGRSRTQILMVGLIYAATIFVTYLALGFGLLTALRETMVVTWLKAALRVVTSAAAAGFAAMSVRDAILIRAGRRSEALLQLSTKTKQRIHGVMRRGVRTGGLAVGTAGLAFVVSLLELACTGQLYLPTIAYLVQTDSTRPLEVMSLVAYNLAFIVPLVAVFLLIFFGASSRRIGRWFSRHAAGAKVFMAAAFALLAAAVWLL